MSRLLRVLVLAGALTAAGRATGSETVPTLGTGPATWWRSDRAPTRWTGEERGLTGAIRWQPGAAGVEWGEVALSGSGAANAIRLIVARIDPALVALELEWGVTGLGRPAWNVDRVDRSTAIALNAGMFVDALPWGWVVTNGTERLAPGRGPLSAAVAITRDGAVLWRDGDRLDDLRRRRDLAVAFQSYPALLSGDGAVPTELAPGSTAIDLGHRDARLSLGVDRTGRLVVAMTRLDTELPGADRLPIGLTVPEMAAVMGALGCQHAMLLDGGLSAQLAIADRSGSVRRWPSLRRVPLALVGRPRPARDAAAR